MSSWCRDLNKRGWRRDIELRSRSGVTFWSCDLKIWVVIWPFGIDVATSFLRSRQRWQKRGRDMKSMSRHRVVFRRVATWLKAGQEKQCRDLVAVYTMVPEAERADQPDVQGMFLLLHVLIGALCLLLLHLV